MKTGYIHSIESFATFEGKGIRTAVFLAGCGMRCVYCHNPDTWDMATGEETTSEALVKRILRFQPYFGKDGGATFSGGEPLMQAEFLTECVDLLQEKGVGSVLDTAMSLLHPAAKELYRSVDTVIGDLKFSGRNDYITYTGSDAFPTVLDTLQYLNELKKPLILRTVIVPGVNDTEQKLAPYLAIATGLSNLEKYELKPFHTMGFQKYQTLGIKNPLQAVAAAEPSRVAALQSFINRSLPNLGQSIRYT